jgi:hypothetical protein
VIDYGACEQYVGCDCIYDVDGNCYIAAGDLGLIAGCWDCMDGDACWMADGCWDMDFDCNGRISGGDLGWYAVDWLQDCADVDATLYPPCNYCEGAVICYEGKLDADDAEVDEDEPLVPSQPGGQPGPPALMAAPVQITLLLQDEPTAAGVEIDPWAAPVRNVAAGELVYAEVWAKHNHMGSDGLTAVFVDLDFDSEKFAVADIESANPFVLFSDPQVQVGTVSSLGGATMSAGHGANEWVRVGTVTFEALESAGRVSISVDLIEREAVSARGLGLVPADDVEILDRAQGPSSFR